MAKYEFFGGPMDGAVGSKVSPWWWGVTVEYDDGSVSVAKYQWCAALCGYAYRVTTRINRDEVAEYRRQGRLGDG